MIDLIKLEKRIERFKIINIGIWAVNIILIFLSFIHFIINDNKLIIDKYFIVLSILNIFSFYLTYRIFDKLNFYKYKYKHFKNLKK
jgi:hypothetical protein